MRKLIAILIGASVGSFVMGILEVLVNVWLARGIGVAVATLLLVMTSKWWVKE